MKTLPPITINQFKCEYCSRIYRRAGNCETHEYKCYLNPERHCLTCDDTGWESWDTLGENLGVIPDGDGRDCASCKIAGEAGGKSYIEK